MIRLVLRSAIDKVEREWNDDASDASDMNDASLHAAWVVSRVTDLLAAAALVVGFGIPTPDRGLRGRRRWVLASDVRVVTDGGGKVRAALNVIDGADRVARFLVDATRKRPGAWWRDDFTLRFATINGLPGVIVDGPRDRCRLRRSRSTAT